MKMCVLFWIGMGRVVFQFIPYKVLFSERQERKFWIREKICGKKERKGEQGENPFGKHSDFTDYKDRSFCCLLLACFLLSNTLDFVAISKN